MAEISAQKVVKVAICGIKCIDLTKEDLMSYFFIWQRSAAWKQLQKNNIKHLKNSKIVETKEPNTGWQNYYF